MKFKISFTYDGWGDPLYYLSAKKGWLKTWQHVCSSPNKEKLMEMARNYEPPEEFSL